MFVILSGIKVYEDVRVGRLTGTEETGGDRTAGGWNRRPVGGRGGELKIIRVLNFAGFCFLQGFSSFRCFFLRFLSFGHAIFFFSLSLSPGVSGLRSQIVLRYGVLPSSLPFSRVLVQVPL